ncbi:MAG: AMP-binding protein [Candidatus Omnitrophica bacterium]|nr:AMP-binding protein [Candidatus Omnitrophota bacterium]
MKPKRVPLHVITITDILEKINKQYGEIPALQVKLKDGSFKALSYVNLGRRAVDLSSKLIQLGIVKNDRVAILSQSRPEWSIALFGIISCAGITVPLDVKLSEKEIQFILNDSQAKCVIVSAQYLGVIDALKSSLPELKHIILMDDSDRKDLILLKDLKMKEGEQKYYPIHPQDTSIMVYTSGTTGVAKGVELTYDNLMFQVRSISDIIRYSSKDQFLSILPLNHMLEITGGLIAPLYAGSCITYAESIKTTTLLALMKETRTTNMICVPLVLKMLHDGIMKKIENLSQRKRTIFYALLNISKFLLRYNIRIGRLLFISIHREFGGRLRGFVSGGAPLSIDIEVTMNALGFRVLQGYGLTETAPVIAVNTFKDNKFGSVGKPLPGVEVTILKENEQAKDGEILTRGPHLMKGYYCNPEKTAEVIKDGWLHTGDIGYLDNEGFLFISGRARNLIVLGAGKKVFPEEVEEVLSKSRYIKEICVIGKIATKGVRKGCEEVYAVIVPHVDAFDSEIQGDKEKIKDVISHEMNRLSENLAEYKRVVDFDVWFDELPKTATRKIKRKVVAEIINNSGKSET